MELGQSVNIMVSQIKLEIVEHAHTCGSNFQQKLEP